MKVVVNAISLIFLYLLFIMDRLILFALPYKQPDFYSFYNDRDRVAIMVDVLIIPIFFVSLYFSKWYWALIVANSYYLLVRLIAWNIKRRNE